MQLVRGLFLVGSLNAAPHPHDHALLKPVLNFLDLYLQARDIRPFVSLSDRVNSPQSVGELVIRSSQDIVRRSVHRGSRDFGERHRGIGEQSTASVNELGSYPQGISEQANKRLSNSFFK